MDGRSAAARPVQAGLPRVGRDAAITTRLLRVLLRTFWLLLGVGALLAAISTARGIVTPGDWMYSDGVQVYHTLRVRDGLPLYADIAVPPFLPLLYGPLLMAAAGTIARLADLDVFGTMYVVRGLSTLSTILAAISIGSLTMVLGAGRRGALASAGLFVTAYVIHPWAYAARPDLPGLGLVMVGLALLLRTRGVAGALGAGLLMGAAFTCKQTFVAGVTAASLVLLWRRDWARLFALAGSWVTVVGVTTAIIDIMSEGRFFAQTLSGNVLPWRIQNVSSQVSIYLAMSVTLLGMAGLGWRPAGTGSTAGWTLTLHGALATILAVSTLGRVGAYYNYLIETTAVLAVFGGLGAERCIAALDEWSNGARTSGRSLLRAVALTGALMLAIGGFGLPLLAMGLMAADPPDRTALIAVLRDAPGPVLTQKDALAVLLAGKEPIAGDPYGVALYARSGRWDPATLNALIRDQRFALVALNQPVEEPVTYDDFPWWPPGTRELIRERYRLDRRLEGFYLYVPASAPAAGDRASAVGAAPLLDLEPADVSD